MSDKLPVLSLAWQLSMFPPPCSKAVRFNPRPPGVIREGSTSDLVLKFLRESGGFKTECQILWKVRRSHSAVSWSLLYLQRQGLVEGRCDPTRNSRYLKYRAARAKDAD